MRFFELVFDWCSIKYTQYISIPFETQILCGVIIGEPPIMPTSPYGSFVRGRSGPHMDSLSFVAGSEGMFQNRGDAL